MKSLTQEQLNELLGVKNDAPVRSDIERKHPLAECEKCPLANERHAPTCGDPDSSIAFVSRSPGKYCIVGSCDIKIALGIKKRKTVRPFLSF